MKPMIRTPAILITAVLLGTTAAHAQSAAATAFPPGPSAQAWPPGPTAQAYPPGPTGQATAQTTNVNVVNAPTVQVGNEVTVKEPVHTPLYIQKLTQIGSGAMYGAFLTVAAPAGSRMVVETVSLSCASSSPQPVAADIHRAGMSNPIVTLVPPPIAWGTATFSAQAIPVRFLVDDSLSVIMYRPTANGATDCAVTLSGYTTPLP